MTRAKKKIEIQYYVAPLRGTHYQPNGNRFSELLLQGESLDLQREPKNKADKNAIAVYWWPPMEIAARLHVGQGSRHKLGYIAAETAALLKGGELLAAFYQPGGMVKIHVAVKV